MPTSFHAKQRVVHRTLGFGTVVEVEGDAVRVELDSDDGERVRTFMASLGTIEPETQASGAAPCASSTASAAAAATASTSPPPAVVAAQPAPPPSKPPRAGTAASAVDRGNPSPAPEIAPAETQARRVLPRKPKPAARSVTPNGSELNDDRPAPQKESPMPDKLLTAMNAAIAERGKGSGAALCATLGLAGGSFKNWRTHGRIPENHRAGVQAWIDKPTIVAIRVAKAPKVIKAPIKPTFNTGKLRVVEPDADLPPIRCAVDAGKILAAMGLTITTAWIQEDGIMRAKAVAVLP
jgi:hypothetical protein